MKKLALVFALFLPSLVWAAPGDGLAGTGHDFAGVGNPQTGICTFCHTPHQAMTQELLWNHTLSTNVFQWTNPTTTGGTDYPAFGGDTYGGPSAKCLSCHDGSVALGDIGWWDATGPQVVLGATIAPNYQIGSVGGVLDGNHPVAMPFPLNGAANVYNGSTNGAASLISGWQADPEALGIKLYNDDGAGNISRGAVPGQTGIECSSCHDVHNGPATQGEYFLLGLLGGSSADYICVKCHDK